MHPEKKNPPQKGGGLWVGCCAIARSKRAVIPAPLSCRPLYGRALPPAGRRSCFGGLPCPRSNGSRCHPRPSLPPPPRGCVAFHFPHCLPRRFSRSATCISGRSLYGVRYASADSIFRGSLRHDRQVPPRRFRYNRIRFRYMLGFWVDIELPDFASYGVTPFHFRFQGPEEGKAAPLLTDKVLYRVCRHFSPTVHFVHSLAPNRRLSDFASRGP